MTEPTTNDGQFTLTDDNEPATLNVLFKVPLKAAKCHCPPEVDDKGNKVGDGTAATCQPCAKELVGIVTLALQTAEQFINFKLKEREGKAGRITLATSLPKDGKLTLKPS